MITYTTANSVFDGPITNLPSIPYILIEVLSRAQAKGRKGLTDFKFGTFIDRLPIDGAASTAVKGLNVSLLYDSQ